ncbi:MAG: DUF6266 family protein [Bacteroidota bacterium]
MGHLRNGPFSGFTGRTGSLVGYRKFGKWVMAAVKATTSRDPSIKQQYVMIRFALITEWLSWVSEFIKIGFKDYAQEMSAMNAAVQYNLEHAVTGVAPAYTIDYEKVLFSRGKLSPAYQLAVATTEDAQLDFTWKALIMNQKGAATDLLTFIVYNPAKQLFVIANSGVDRADLTYDMALPVEFSGDNVYVWAALRSADGEAISTSQYVTATVVQ